MIATSKLFVSIVMPSLNEDSYIRSAIESVTPCSREFDYELIVADGGSTDSTRSIVERMCGTNKGIGLIANDSPHTAIFDFHGQKRTQQAKRPCTGFREAYAESCICKAKELFLLIPMFRDMSRKRRALAQRE